MSDSVQTIERPKDDCYPTPPEATRALLSVEAFPGGIWEPCSGPGFMAAALREDGHTVRATTIGEGRHEKAFPKYRVIGGVDFLQEERSSHPNIVTNPPYGKLNGLDDKEAAEKFVRHAVSMPGVTKVAMLLSMQFLGGTGRKDGLFKEMPPARFYQFSNRIKFYPYGVDSSKKAPPNYYYGWFVWEYPFGSGLPQFAGWLNSKEFRS